MTSLVAFDSTFLTFIFVPNATCSVDRPKDRIDNLIGELHGSGGRIVIPTPALSELLIRTGPATQDILRVLGRSPKFMIHPFDVLAAVEMAAISRNALLRGDKKGGSKAIWAKVKFDRQIVAISKVAGASVIYSEDHDIGNLAAEAGLHSKSLKDLALPPPPNAGRLLF